MNNCLGVGLLAIVLIAIVFTIKAVLGLWLLSLLVPSLIVFSLKNCIIFFFFLACISFKFDVSTK